MYCQGLNRYIFHRYAMQPWTNRWPGMTMGHWGFHFERTETWWQPGKAWIDYISHCQFLLQQGHAVADAAYFTGESAPVEMRVGNPALPAGYDYDAVNADVLLHGAKVKNGRLTLASGANYAVLILPPDDVNMTPQTLEVPPQTGARRRNRCRPAPATFAESRGFSELRHAGEKTRRRTLGPMRRHQCFGKRRRQRPHRLGQISGRRFRRATFEAGF